MPDLCASSVLPLSMEMSNMLAISDREIMPMMITLNNVAKPGCCFVFLTYCCCNIICLTIIQITPAGGVVITYCILHPDCSGGTGGSSVTKS